MRKLHYILIAMLAIGCSQDPIDETTTNELIEVDFTTSGSITRAEEEGDTTIPTTEDMQFSLISSSSTTGAASSSCVYTYNDNDNTFTRAEGSTGLSVSTNTSYYLRIAAPASAISKVGNKSYYGHIIERNPDTPLYISDPIAVTVDGIVITTGGTSYIHDLDEVTLYQQRSKVKVSLKCAEEQVYRTVNTLYYKDVYAQGYRVISSGTSTTIFSDLDTPETVYSFSQFPLDNPTPVIYKENEEGTYTLAPTTGEDDENECTYFVSADYSESGSTYPVLVVGLKDGDDDTREVDVPLNINMEIYKQYDYEITVSSVVLTVNVSVSDWDKVADDSTIGGTIASFEVNIDTGDITWEIGGGDTAIQESVEEEVITQTVDFTTEDNSNCYILNPVSDGSSRYYIPISRIDEFWQDETYVEDADIRNAYNLTAIGDNWEAVMSWHDFNSSTTFEPINKVTFEQGISPTGKDCVVVTIPSSFANPDNHCNIGYVVRATNIDGTPVLWSWHLWITDYDPYGAQRESTEFAGYVYEVDGGALHRYDNTYFTTGIYADKLIMDRNIGARSPDYEGHGSSTSPGMIHYQFGRKDPFPAYYNSVNGYTSSTTSGSCSLEDGVQNPRTFITRTYTTERNWCNEVTSNSYIWNDYTISTTNYTTGKSIFDPSPWGFRVPINGTWTGFTGSSEANETAEGNSYTFLWTNYFDDPGDYAYGRLYNGFAYYRASGLKYFNTGGLFHIGTNGQYWSATPYSITYGTSYNMYFSSTDVVASCYSNSTNSTGSYSFSHRPQGFSVRPVQE